MRKTFAIAAMTAAALTLSACKDDDNDNNNTAETQATQTETQQTPTQRVAAPTINHDEYRRDMRAAVEITSVTPAYQIPALTAELEAAQDIAGDDLNEDGFLALTYTVTTPHGMIREVDTIAFCNEHIGNSNYNDNCAESIAWNIAATNSAYNNTLEHHVPTDNPEIRENALVDLRWLRTAMSTHAANNNYHVVRDIRNVESVTGLTADAFIPEPDTEEAFEDKKERILSAVALHSVSQAMEDPDTYKELTEAQQIVGDTLDPSGFLNFSFHVATRNGELRQMDVLGYCEEFIGDHDYVEACSDEMSMKIAATNSTSAFSLESNVATDNPLLRENALVSVEWLRRALDFSSQENNYLVVRNITTLDAPRP